MLFKSHIHSSNYYALCLMQDFMCSKQSVNKKTVLLMPKEATMKISLKILINKPGFCNI